MPASICHPVPGCRRYAFEWYRMPLSPWFQREAARAQGFKLADVGRMRHGIAGERPDLFNLVGFDPHHSRADGRGQKLVQAGSEVIAVQVGDLEVEQAE